MSRRQYVAPTSVRLLPPIHASLKAEAAARGLDLADVIRERVDLTVYFRDQLDHLRADLLAEVAAQPARGGGAGADPAILTELLLLLRTLAGPARCNAITSELTRLGFTPWSAPEAPDAPR